MATKKVKKKQIKDFKHDIRHDHIEATGDDKGKWVRSNPDTGEIEYVAEPAGDKNYVTAIEHQQTATINHNLSKKPAVSFSLSEGDKVICEIIYINNNSVQLVFEDYYSGEIICN